MRLKTFMEVCGNFKLTLSVWHGGTFIKEFHINAMENSEEFDKIILLCENFRVDNIVARQKSLFIELDTAI